MSRVFVVQSNARHNLTPAMQYGYLEMILPAQDLDLDPNQLYDYIQKKLETADRETDWLLLSGDPVAIGLACLAWDDQALGHLRVLKWDNRACDYKPYIIQSGETEHV